MLIRPIEPADRACWEPLWQAYCTFYGVTLSDEVSDATWDAILDPASPVGGRAAIGDAGAWLGFAHHVLHPTTWALAPSCYLEDLFVAPAARGRGVGRALIDDLFAWAREGGCNRVYWHTNSDNSAARLLYDSYGPADPFVRYRFPL